MVPKDQTAALGDTVYFTCTARGVPKPQITWYRNTMILPPDESIILSDNNQNLTITEISGDDDGIYHCRAENSEGLTEISAFLKVEQNKIIVPKIVLRPEDLDAFEETSVQLPCEYESEPPGNVEWRKNGNRLTTNDRLSITIIGSLVIKNITLADSGSYECSVHNEYGRDTAAAFLTVKNRVVPGEEYINIALTQATRDVDQAIARTVEELFNNKRRAALRFGHSIINPILNRYDENFETIPQGHLLLRDAFFSPWRLVDEGGVDPLLRGMFVTPAKLKTPTQNLNSELTEKLFYSAHAVALDLAAMNIQRGRDHGIPAYTKWRDFCNMTEVNSFDDLANEISDPSVRAKLKDLYGSVFNIDVWVGGILEDQVEGGMVGPLFRCLLIEQFQRLRSGDRFWYENPSTFKSDQLRELKLKTNLARIICDNADNIDTINQNVFVLPEIQEGLMSCDDLPKIDLRYWMDCKTCHDNFDLENNRVRRDIGKANLADQLKENEFMLEDLQDSVNILKSTVKDLRKKVEELEMKINKK
ncbi:unnamed protein product [Leptidea sinapis]|uniref:Ig-like domain-containing protein n=1 Tax=Leptidea sinapis TaxID=189913 RepID=A0A5E4QT96_9NEOP|nr:unnamed protein product [Leptidea sinapis]